MRNAFNETLKIALIPNAIPGSNFDFPCPWDDIKITSEEWWQQKFCIHHTFILSLSRFSVWYLIIHCKFSESKAHIYQNLCLFWLGKLKRRQSLFLEAWWISQSLKKNSASHELCIGWGGWRRLKQPKSLLSGNLSFSGEATWKKIKQKKNLKNHKLWKILQRK